jgi:LPXTG-motif cell wall-anchored protein
VTSGALKLSVVALGAVALLAGAGLLIIGRRRRRA